MSTYLSDHSSISCPICSQTSSPKDRLVSSGLLFCEHCHERIVVSWSGSYVRDPLSSNAIETPFFIPRQDPPRLKGAVRQGRQALWIKFMAGLIIAILFWTGLYRLAVSHGRVKTPSYFSPKSTQVQ